MKKFTKLRSAWLIENNLFMLRTPTYPIVGFKVSSKTPSLLEKSAKTPLKLKHDQTCLNPCPLMKVTFKLRKRNPTITSRGRLVCYYPKKEETFSCSLSGHPVLCSIIYWKRWPTYGNALQTIFGFWGLEIPHEPPSPTVCRFVLHNNNSCLCWNYYKRT